MFRRLIPGAPGGPGGPGQGPLRPRGVVVPWWIHLVEIAIIGAVILLVVLIIFWALRSPRVMGPPRTMVTPALTELDLRYARGEIDHADYATRRANLLGLAQAPPAEPAPAAESPPGDPPNT